MNVVDAMDEYGGYIFFGVATVFGVIAGVAYALPLEEATKMNVWGACALTFFGFVALFLAWWVVAMFVGVGKGVSEAVRAHKARMGQLDRLDPAARARYDELANGPAVYYDISGRPKDNDRPQT